MQKLHNVSLTVLAKPCEKSSRFFESVLLESISNHDALSVALLYFLAVVCRLQDPNEDVTMEAVQMARSQAAFGYCVR